MRTFIVIISIENVDARKICETFEGCKFDIGGSVQATETDVKNALIEEIKKYYKTEVLEFPTEDIEVWNMSDFMDMSNDEEYYVDNFFMGYVFG